MSGSRSSAPEASAAAPEPIGLTVHNLPRPDAAMLDRRTAMGRVKMLLILAVCAAPVAASYIMYFAVRPEVRSNYAELIQPTRSLPPGLPLVDQEGRAVAPESLRRQWLLVVLAPAACDAGCERRLYFQRQMHLMLGKDAQRLDKLWIVLDDAALPGALLTGLTGGSYPVRILRSPRAAVAQWLEPAAGQALEDHLYVVDPMGEWMMRVPVQPDPARLKRDLERLLRASSWWQPGRS